MFSDQHQKHKPVTEKSKMGEPIQRGFWPTRDKSSHLCFLISTKNTNLVEDVETLVKFHLSIDEKSKMARPIRFQSTSSFSTWPEKCKPGGGHSWASSLFNINLFEKTYLFF